MPSDNPLVQQAAQRADQQSAQDAQSDLMASMYRGGDPFSGGMYGGYGAGGVSGVGGVMPKRDFGFEEYVSHYLGMARHNAKDNTIKAGPYAGLTNSQAIEKMRQDYGQMSEQERKPWEALRFNKDVRSNGEMQDQGFEYVDQTQQWGAKGMLNQPDGAPNYGGGPAPQPGFSSNPRALLSPGTMNSAPAGSVHHGMDEVGDSDQRGFQLGDANGMVHHQGDAIPAGTVFPNMPSGQRGAVPSPAYQPSNLVVPPAGTDSDHSAMSTSPGVVSNPNMDYSHPPQPGNAPIPFTPRPMGDPNDTARFGPRMQDVGAGGRVNPANLPSFTGPPSPQSGMDRAGAEDAAATGSRFVSGSYKPPAMPGSAAVQPLRPMNGSSASFDPFASNMRAQQEDAPSGGRVFPVGTGSNPNLAGGSPLPQPMISDNRAGRLSMMPNPAFVSPQRPMNAPLVSPMNYTVGTGRGTRFVPPMDYRAMSEDGTLPNSQIARQPALINPPGASVAVR